MRSVVRTADLSRGSSLCSNGGSPTVRSACDQSGQVGYHSPECGTVAGTFVRPMCQDSGTGASLSVSDVIGSRSGIGLQMTGGPSDLSICPHPETQSSDAPGHHPLALAWRIDVIPTMCDPYGDEAGPPRAGGGLGQKHFAQLRGPGGGHVTACRVMHAIAAFLPPARRAWQPPVRAPPPASSAPNPARC
jgi:hypothetical protein